MTLRTFCARVPMMALLISSVSMGCAPSEPTLQELAEEGDAAAIQSRIDSGVEIDGRKKIGWTALHHAALGGHVEVVEILVDAGADVNLRTNFGQRTALHFAAENGHAATVELLLKAGAKPSEPDSDNKTPLDLAAEGGHGAIVASLQGAAETGTDTTADEE